MDCGSLQLHLKRFSQRNCTQLGTRATFLIQMILKNDNNSKNPKY